MKEQRTLIAALIALLVGCATLKAQAQADTWKSEKQVGLVFGLTQPLVVNGFNVEGVFMHQRFIFNYSHGMSLDFSGSLLPDYLQEQGLVVHMPFSTGFGVGYRITEWLNLRVEPKWHRFEFHYSEDLSRELGAVAVDEHNFSVGLGLYGFFQPFRQKSNFLSGITIAPSIRYWPTVASSFENNREEYFNKHTGQVEELQSLGSGIGFSPLIINVSIGYTLKL